MTFQLTARIDWLAMTFKDPLKLYELLGDCSTIATNSMWGYDTAQLTEDGIKILMSSTRKDMGLHIVCNATSLDKYQIRTQTTPVGLLHRALDQKATIKRLDLCIDVKGDVFSIRRIVAEYDKGNVKTKARAGSVIRGIGDDGYTLYVGKRGSRKLLRIYNKAAQLGVDENWARIELELRRDAAHQASTILIKSQSWQHEIPKLIKGFVDFENCNQWRTVIGITEIAIEQPVIEDSKTRRWLLEVCAVSMARLYTEGDTDILKDVIRVASDLIRTANKQERPLINSSKFDMIGANKT